MKASVVEMTPELAASLLERNTRNRNPKKGHVENLAHQMAEGLWKENGEAIIVDKNGDLSDGQHRLKACLLSGKSFRVVLVQGVEPTVMDTIDTGSNRSLKDMLQLEGFKNHMDRRFPKTDKKTINDRLPCRTIL